MKNLLFGILILLSLSSLAETMPYQDLESQIDCEQNCGDYFAWDSNKYCSLYAGSGRRKYTVNDENCGENYYKWGANGYCNLYAGSGRKKYTVDDTFCSTCRDEEK